MRSDIGPALHLAGICPNRGSRNAALGAQRSVSRREIRLAVPAPGLDDRVADLLSGEHCPEKWRLVFAINPLTGIIDGFRSSLFGRPFDWPIIGVSSLSIVVSCVVSLYIFKRMEDDFADVI